MSNNPDEITIESRADRIYGNVKAFQEKHDIPFTTAVAIINLALTEECSVHQHHALDSIDESMTFIDAALRKG
jgi:hypothetical protein